MRLLYEIIFTAAFFLSWPFYFLKMWKRGNWRRGFGERFARYDHKVKQAVTNAQVLWLHGVSVGEVNMGIQLIRHLEPRLPHFRIIFSTTTSTGMSEMRRQLPAHVVKIYYPIDRRKWTRRALATLHPSVVVLLESEIWPNFLWNAKRRGIPCLLLNARMSENSYRGYRRLGFLFRSLFGQFAAVSTQTDEEKQRLIGLGCRPEAVHVVGSLKFDSVDLDLKRPINVGQLLRQCGVSEKALILFGGSTHPGEEKMLIDIYRRLKPRFPDLFLVLVPRHAERGGSVGDELEEAGLKFIYRNQITPKTDLKDRQLDCLLVNTTGELRFFYECADVVFVGGSLTTPTGQNPIEPASLGKPVLFGPGMRDFYYIVLSFLKANAAIEVKTPEELETQVTRLLEDPQLREDMGRRALNVIKQNRGALERTMDLILEQLPAGEDTDD